MGGYKKIMAGNDLTPDRQRTTRGRKKNAKTYYEKWATWDIEATNYHEPGTDIRAGVVYLWTFAADTENVYYGRDMESFVDFLGQVSAALAGDTDPAEGPFLVVYVHNLAYEFQFLRKLLDWTDVFLVGARRPLYAVWRNIEFRCSYCLSNMSLDKFLKNNGCEIQKLVYDYDKSRYPWEPISDADLTYCVHDTAGLWECLKRVMDAEGHTVATIPLTSTGYVRRDVKESQSKTVRKQIDRLARVSPELYTALKGAFVGGNTHANRFYVGEELNDIYCYDIASSYPYAQLCFDFPVTPFRHFKGDYGRIDAAEASDVAWLLKVTWTGLRLKDPCDGMPVISVSKTLDVDGYDIDNGRVLDADTLTIWVTDIEYRIIREHYMAEAETITDAYYSQYGPLPECIKACIYQYFENKTLLKKKDPYLYRKSKEKLNSIYGMAAFDIGKRRYTYTNGDYVQDTSDLADILAAGYEHGHAAEPYAWGVWTTARARENLDRIIRLAGDRFVYCDTDSCYCFGELDVSALNAEAASRACEYTVHTPERDYYPGRWEIDKECQAFKTLGAKKYCYRDAAGTHTVTAGVSKAAGVKDISEYCLGHVFKGATSNVWYQDAPIALTIDGHALEIETSAYIESGDYTLGITNVYNALLAAIKGIDNNENYVFI